MKTILLYAAVAAAFVSAGTAHAAATQVNFGFVPRAVVTYVGSSLGSSTQLNFGNPSETTVLGTGQFADDSGAFVGIFPFSFGMEVTLTPSVFNYVVGQPSSLAPGTVQKTFTTGPGGALNSAGLYTATFTTLTASSSDPNFLNLTFEGTITGPDGFNANDVMLINCNQSGGEGAVACSATQTAPPIPTQVPEPATLGLVGLALAGLAAASRRRRPS